MESLEQSLRDAFMVHDLPGVVLTAQDRTGKINYSKAIGNVSYRDGAQPMTLDSTFFLASTSKLVTTIAALQCVEKGHFTLDEDVTRILPEFKDIQILTGFNEGSGEPTLIPSTNVITLRHLLTHSSGIGYDHFDALLIRYRQWQKYPIDFTRTGKVVENYLYPLLFEPGTSFQYGAGIDWAGVMCQRVNGDISLEEYVQTNICVPLGISHMTFHLEQHEHIRDKIVPTAMRSGGLDMFGVAQDPEGKVEDINYQWFPDPVGDEYGGAGLISSASDYQKVLSNLVNGNILKSSTVLEMTEPQLSPQARQAFMDTRQIPQVAQATAPGQAMDAELDHGLGGCLNLADTPEGRRKGTISWSGLPNTYWWADLDAGVSGTLFMALFPTGDAKANGFFNRFQRAIYDALES